ncbi:MAG: NAD-dependent epimerase/dehydratase family protein [Planctomycetota bacterium]
MDPTDWRSHHGGAYDGARVLVTGGQGFIGSHLTDALLALGAHVAVIDDGSGGGQGNLDPGLAKHPDRLRFVEASILDADALTNAIDGARVVFHQAALGSVPRSLEMPERYHAVNAEGTLRVLQAAKEAGAERVVFAASSSAYGDTPTLPKVETMPVLPRSPYAATKAYGEALLRAWANGYPDGPDAASLRYFNIFGPRQNANSAYAAVIAAFAKALLAGENPHVHGDGEQSRDFTFVDNAVHANLLAGRSETRLSGAVFNVACGQRVTINQLAEAMAHKFERPQLSPTHGPDRAGDVKHSLADLGAIRDTIGYAPLVSFEDGLSVTCDWYAQALSASASA